MCSLYERQDELKGSFTKFTQLTKCCNKLDKIHYILAQNISYLSKDIDFNSQINSLNDKKSKFGLKLCHISDKMLTNDAINETKTAEKKRNIGKSGKHFKCFWPKCLFKTLDSRLLKEHYSVHQKTKNQFKCDVNNCQKVFKYKQNLIQHKLSHKSNPSIKGLQLIARNGGNYSTKGDENGKNGHKSGLIFAHKSNVLLNSTKMASNIQNNTDLTDRQSLKIKPKRSADHKRAQLCRKPKDKRFVCDYSGCDKCFDSKSNLERHKRIHSGEKPFGCDIPGCDQRFTQKTHLVQHKKRKHHIILPKNAIKLIKPDDYGLKVETPVSSPVLSTPKPVLNSTIKPFVNSPKLVVNSPKPTLNSTKTAVNSTKSSMNSTKTPTNSPKPSATVNSTKVVVNSTTLKTMSSSGNKSALNSSKTLTNVSDKSLNSSEIIPNSVEKQYKCYYSKCEYSYDSLYELKTHINSVHTNETLNKCHETNCNEVFKSFYNLYYHKKSFHKLV